MAPISAALLTSAPAWRGSGTSLAKIAGGLQRAGHRAVVLAGSAAVRARFESGGASVRQVPLDRTGWREMRAVSRVLRSEGTQVVLADMERDLRLAALATLFRPLPLIFRYNLSRRTLEGHAGVRFLFRRVGMITFQSSYARDRALRTSPWLGRWPSAVIANGYDSDLLRPDATAALEFRRTHAIAADASVVVSGAALFLDKGYAVAVEAMRIVRGSREVEYLVCGAGDDAAAISTLADRAGLKVRFTGQLDQAAWLAALNAADVVLHPTPGELFPNIVAEAMVVGRPLVAVDSGATPELVGRNGSAGVLVAEGDAAGLATAVQALLDDREKGTRMGRAARERISREFPIDKMEKGYVRLIESLVR